MRFRPRLALIGPALVFAAALAAPAADAPPPPPLLKPVVPAGTQQLRVRLPLTPGFPKTMSFEAQVPRNKTKEPIDVRAALDTLPDKSYVTAKKLESWGYDVPKDKEFLLPELTFTAVQTAPKPMKGHDAVVRLTNLKLTVVDAPASSDNTVHQCDLSLSARTLYLGNERAMEPRVAFGDKFFELTVPTAIAKRPGTDGAALADVTAAADAKLVPAYAPMTLRAGLQVFNYAAVNGQTAYKTADGKSIPVSVAVASIVNVPPGVVVTIGLARGCKVEIDQGAPATAATGVDVKSEFIPAKIKELRLGVNTGPGMKTVKDLVLKDLPVLVDKNQSEGYLLIGQKFMDEHFADAVYAGTADGWKLHGRLDPALLLDIKTRPKQKP
jgi:hypothetical protein